MEFSNIIAQTEKGFRLYCPVCGSTQTFINLADENAPQATKARCKRCQNPIAGRHAIETEIEHLCGTNKKLKLCMDEQIFRHIEAID